MLVFASAIFEHGLEESVYSKIVQGVKCCSFASEDTNCSECPYGDCGCADALEMDLLHFLEFFSSVDGWAEALGLKKFVIGGENDNYQKKSAFSADFSFCCWILAGHALAVQVLRTYF